MSLFESPDKNPKSKRPGKDHDRTLILQFDGGSRGNPGPAGIGVTITTDTGERLYELGEFLAPCTNNVAEYTALLRGLAAAIALHAGKLLVRADSELVVRQLNGIYKVKSPDLKPLYEKAQSLIRQLPDVKISHVYRESNSRADALANQAMDAKKKIEPLGALECVAKGHPTATPSAEGHSAIPAAKPVHTPAPRSAIDLKIIEATPADLPPVIALSRLCAYDLSDHLQTPTPPDGSFRLRPEAFWQTPAVTPFLIKVHSELAGFAAISTASPAAYTLEEFFILKKFRRQKVGTFMLRTLFNRHPGPWQITQPTHPTAFAFIEKILAPYTPTLTGNVYHFNTD